MWELNLHLTCYSDFDTGGRDLLTKEDGGRDHERPRIDIGLERAKRKTLENPPEKLN